MNENSLVPLRCRVDALTALAAHLERFGPTDGAPNWLISGVWLCTKDRQFIATPSVEVLSDGYVARPLAIDPPSELVGQIEAELPDIEARLVGRRDALKLPLSDAVPDVPETLRDWPTRPYSLSVLVRIAVRASVTHRVACALLFCAEGRPLLLVGTDPSNLAMVLSEDPALIDAYREPCEEFTIAEYQGQRPR